MDDGHDSSFPSVQINDSILYYYRICVQNTPDYLKLFYRDHAFLMILNQLPWKTLLISCSE